MPSFYFAPKFASFPPYHPDCTCGNPVNRAPAAGIGPPTYSPRPEMTGFRLDPGAYTVVSLAGRGLSLLARCRPPGPSVRHDRAGDVL